MRRTVWLGLLVVLLALVGGLFYLRHVRQATANQAQSTTVQYQGQRGKSALDLLKSHATIKTATDSKFGEYVTSINGVESGVGGKYWLLIVNDIPISALSASTYQTQSTDSIEWKLE